MKKKEIKAFAFDLDGTLVDSIDDLVNAANATRTHLDMSPLPKEVLHNFIGDGIASLVHRTLSNHHNELAEQTLWEEGLAYFIQYYKNHLTDFTKPYPEVAETLSLLKTLGYPLTVITNKNEKLAYQILNDLNLIDYFSLIIGGDTLIEKKPSALPLIHTAEVLNIQTRELAMVGDSINDIKAANNAHSFSIGVTYGYDDLKTIQSEGKLSIHLLVNRMIDIYHTFNNIDD